MQKIILLLSLSTLLLLGKEFEPNDMRTQNNNHQQNYDNSSHVHNTEDRIISSTVEASSEISVGLTIQGLSEITSEATSGKGHGTARMSFLDNNRIQITQDIAQGHGEHLDTLLHMMNIQNDEKNLEKIQKSFDELIYLSHNDFLTKLKTII